MKATDFDLNKDLTLDPTTGIAAFRGSRVVLFDAAAIGLLRQDLVERIGPTETRRLFLRFGYQQGFADFLQMKLGYQFDNEMELLASGPVIHSWEGIVRASPTEIRFSRDTGDFHFTGTWENSYEAEQYLTFNHTSQEPVCWSLMGYASGWCTAFFGSPLICVEPNCAGKGDKHCGWLIQPPQVLGDLGRPYLECLADLLEAN